MVKLGALALGLLSVVAEVSAQRTVNIMPFGASIVSRCWRANLQTKLRDNGISNFNFIGTQKSSCGGSNIDQDHEGHPGSLATDYAAKGNLTTWLNAIDKPDIILMLLGTNDVLLGKKPVAEVLAAYDVLIDQMRQRNSKVRLMFSNLLPLDPARWGKTGADGIVALNNAIRSYAPGKSTRDSPVVFVDNFSGFDAVADTTDGEHPNDAGNAKMGDRFYGPTRDAIKAINDAEGEDASAAAPEENGKGNAEADVQKATSAPTPTPTPSGPPQTQSQTQTSAPAKSSVPPAAAAVLAPSAASAALPSAPSPPSASNPPASGSASGSPTSLVASVSPTTLAPAKATAAGTPAAPTASSLASSGSSLSGAWPVRLIKSVRGVVAVAAFQGREL